MQTKNSVTIRGFVGRFIKDPRDRDDPTRFDVLTVERVRTSGRTRETVSKKDWHTVKTWDRSIIEKIHPGACVEIEGRLDTRMVGKNNEMLRQVEVVAESVDVLMTQRERDLLRDYEE